MSKYRVTASPTLNIRQDPSRNHAPIGSFAEGDIVEEIKRSPDNKWSEVRKDGSQGWVSNEYLELIKDPADSVDGTDWLDWTEKAMIISGSFEGSGTDWGNPTGNFDGAYLTCGLLGFTWKWNNQPPMVKEFVKRKGEAALLTLMPQSGRAYLDAVSKGEIGGAPIVSSWSVGEKVKEPYKSELSAFWSSPEMKKIQKETALTMMGVFAKRKTIEGQKYYNLPKPRFSHYAYWFDQAVLNGTSKTQDFEKAESISVDQVFNWMATETGYTQKSFDANRTYWKTIINTVDDIQRKMWILAYLRSDVSNEKFDTVVMCRRGSLALGKGYVNGTLRDFGFTNAPAAAPVTTAAAPDTAGNTFLQLATAVGQKEPAEELIKYKNAHNPNGNPRYWAIADFNQHSKNKRFYLFDTRDNETVRYFVAHGKGSDPDNNGIADIFSNVPNSKCSSLGIYRCSETYSGKHGFSLKLDGLENTNSNARDRAVVLHKADYVSDSFIAANGHIGRSDGCFVVEDSVSETVINQLKNGSFIIAWKK